jgi:hypothetical protein
MPEDSAPAAEAVAVLAPTAAVTGDPIDPGHDSAESLEEVRDRLDAELSRFEVQDEERVHAEVPLPDIEGALPDDEAASETPLETAAWAATPDADLDNSDIAIREPADGEFAPAGPGFEDASEALQVAVADASRVADAAVAADTLEAVARRVRNGEITIGPGADPGNSAAVLAAVLAFLLGGRE